MIKKLFLILWGLLFCDFISAQTPYWLHSAGNTSSDEAYDIAVDDSNNSITTGYFSGKVDFKTLTQNISVNSHGVSDILIAKTDDAGTYKWITHAGGPNDDRGKSVATDHFGNIYLTGYFTYLSYFDTTQILSHGFQDMFVAKYNSNGVLLWVRNGGGKLNDVGNSVAVDNAGNVLVTGQFIDTAYFGNITLVSMIEPVSGIPSVDVFTCKYDPNGNLLWAKKGSAKYTDGGVGVKCDGSRNVYITGQFSDTISFGNTHDNNLYNSIFLLKYDENGNEQWFKKIGGGQVNRVHDIAINDTGVFITGEIKGNTIFFDLTNVTINNPHLNKIFIARYDFNGNLIFAKGDGSDGELYSKSIALDDSANIYIGGMFTCIFSDYAADYGEGTFNTVGFKDIFVAKYNANGSRQWMRQAGGQYEDFLGGVEVNSYGQVFLAGSYNGKIVFPRSNNFIHDNNWYVEEDLWPAYLNTTNCSDSLIYDYYQKFSNGFTDLFIGKAIDLNRSPYYYYNYSDSSCLKKRLGVCINGTGIDDYCDQDTLKKCVYEVLTAGSQTSHVYDYYSFNSNSPGPLFNYLWSTGGTTWEITVNASGKYWVRITSIDGCFESSDTIDVVIYPIPAAPLVSDSKGINVNSLSPLPIFLCKSDSVLLTMSGVGNNTPIWSIDNWGNGYIDTSLTYNFQSDSFPAPNQTYNSAIVVSPFGCANSTPIIIKIDTLSFPINPYLVLENDSDKNDSVKICYGDDFYLRIYDSIQNPPYNGCYIPYVYPIWSVNPLIPFSPYCGNLESGFFPSVSGWYNVSSTVTQYSPCGGTQDTFLLNKNVYVEVVPPPILNPIITGPHFLCPDDSILLVASGGNNYSWNGPGIISNPDSSIIWIDLPGYYEVFVSDTFDICVTNDYTNIYIFNPTPPTVSINPPDGLVCPGDSVELTVVGSGNKAWYGPMGPISSTSSVIYASVPGYYYCITDSGGCQLLSNTVELIQYATPFINVTPSEFLCPGESAVLEVVTNPGSLLQWQPPLSGSSLTQTVTTGGVYTCSVSSCNITTIASAIIIASNAFSSIIPPGPISFCTGDSVQLTGNPGMVMYEWFPEFSNNPFITVNQTGNYFLVTTDGYGCTDTSATVSVTVLQAPDAPIISGDSILCVGDTLHLLTPTIASTIYNWNGPLNFHSNNDSVVVSNVSVQNSGTYSLSTTQSICSSAVSYWNVTIDSLPPVIISEVQNVCYGDPVTISASAISGAAYSWQTPSGMMSSNNSININTFSQNDNGIYSVKVALGNCRDSAFIDIKSEDCDEYIPNVFSPNNDGNNDFFQLYNFKLEKIDATIFNRWGKLIYHWNTVDGYWDGTNEATGKKVSEGTYYYIIEIKRKSGSEQTFKGNILVIE